MASLFKTSRGGRAIQFGSPKRCTLHLGHVSLKSGNTIRGHVDELINAKATNTPAPPSTAAWLGEIGDKLHGKLVALKLAKPRIGANAVLLGAFIDGYIAKRTDLKDSTRVNLVQGRKKLIGFFTADRDLTTITRGDMQDYHRHLLTTLSGPSVSGHFKRAILFFQDAVSRNIIAVNPARGIKCGGQDNPERLQYVYADEVMRVIEATADAEWQLLFALARFAGLRIPSESAALKWPDVDFVAGRMTVRASKTERHSNRGVRVVPIFPELRPHLWAAWLRCGSADGVAPISGRRSVVAWPQNWCRKGRHGSQKSLPQSVQFRPATLDSYVTPTLRRENLRRMAEKLIARAGVEAWPRLFQNLRASCEMDLADHFPEHVVCRWIGHTSKIARKHYLGVKEEHYRLAAGKPAAPEGRRTAAPTAPVGESGATAAVAELADARLDWSAPVLSTGDAGSPKKITTAHAGSYPARSTEFELNAAPAAAHIDESYAFVLDLSEDSTPVGVNHFSQTPIKSRVLARRPVPSRGTRRHPAQRIPQRKLIGMRDADELRRLLPPLMLVPAGGAA